MPFPNVPELRSLKRFLNDNQENVDQDTWGQRQTRQTQLAECGTVACAAGWTLIRNNVKLVWKQSEGRLSYREIMDAVYDPKYRKYGIAGIPIAAADVLGLNDGEAQALFYGAKDLDDVNETIDSIIAGDFRSDEEMGNYNV